MSAVNVRPFFSVIMPLYGVAEYLPASLSCILAQTFEDFELILVDDASTDGSLAIAEAAAAMDDRVRIVRHPENRGVSETRNSGLRVALGRYLWMCDADDEYELDLLERAASALGQVPGGADALVFGLTERYFDPNGAFLYEHTILPKAGVYPDLADWADQLPLLERDTLFGYVWNSCYKRELVERAGLRFESLRLIEDVLFNCHFFANARSLVCLDAPLYLYRKQDGRSLTNANAYSAREFWAVHERRVSELCALYEAAACSEEAYAIEGSLYVRYIVSALERTFHDSEAWRLASRNAFLDEIFESELFGKLVPQAKAESSKTLQLAVSAAQRRSKPMLLSIAASAYAARMLSPSTFTRTRSGR